jgi:hypothetical protein
MSRTSLLPAPIRGDRRGHGEAEEEAGDQEKGADILLVDQIHITVDCLDREDLIPSFFQSRAEFLDLEAELLVVLLEEIMIVYVGLRDHKERAFWIDARLEDRRRAGEDFPRDLGRSGRWGNCRRYVTGRAVNSKTQQT